LSRFLAIDSDHGVVHVAAGTVRAGQVRLDHAISVRLGEPLNPANAADLGRQFRDALRTAGIAPAPVIAAVGRDRVILKDVKVPKASPAEEPALIRFAASKDMTEAADSVVLDYYPLDRVDADGQVRAVTASVRKDLLAAYKTCCQAAGLKPTGITTRPIGTLAALDRAIASGDVTAPEQRRASVAIVTRGEKWGELVIARDDQVVFSRAISATALTAEPMLLGEIRRNLAVFNGQNPQQPVEALYVAEAAGPAGHWSARIRAGLQIPVQAFDPLAGVTHDTAPEDRGHFAPLVGLLQLKAGTKPLPIDFLSPRQAVVKESYNKRLLQAGLAAALLLLIGGLGFGYARVMQKQTEYAKLVKEKNELDKALKEMEEDEKRMKAFKEWDDTRINWLDEMYDMAVRFPDINRMRLDGFRAEPLAVQKNARVKYVARLFLKVQTEDGRLMDNLQAAIAADKKYHNIRKDIKGGAGGFGFSRFSQSYELRADLEKRTASDYVRKLNASAPPRPTRSRNQGGEGFDGFGGGGMGGGFPGGFGGPGQ
jgi:Tfp pilus assembly PilM family ATPase